MVGLITGIVASTAHVISGPDHLAAVTPLAIDSRRKSWVIGFSWGIGHTTGMLIIGCLFILLKGVLPVDKITTHSDILVGIILIAIGLWAILRTLKKRLPHHVHEENPHELEKNWHQNAVTALLVGIVHGFSGFSHLLAVLPALALPSIEASVFYLAGFAAGTILSMVVVTLLLGTIAYRSSVKKKSNFLFGFSLGGGILAMGTGIFWIIRSL